MDDGNTLRNYKEDIIYIFLGQYSIIILLINTINVSGSIFAQITTSIVISYFIVILYIGLLYLLKKRVLKVVSRTLLVFFITSIIIFMIYFIFLPTYLNNDNCRYKISIDTKLGYNNSVGDDWIVVVRLNWRELDEVEYEKGVKLKQVKNRLDIMIIEADNYNDIGSSYFYFERDRKTIKDLKIIVEENRGRYSGNRAIWDCDVVVKRSVNLWTVLSFAIDDTTSWMWD